MKANKSNSHNNRTEEKERQDDVLKFCVSDTQLGHEYTQLLRMLEQD